MRYKTSNWGINPRHSFRMDAVKRREARRKRLLESSEDRFRRIERLKMKSQELDEAPCDCGNVASSIQSSLDHQPKSDAEADILRPSASKELTTETAGREEDTRTYSSTSFLPSHHASDSYSCQYVDRTESQDNRAETSTTPAGVDENNLPRDISQDSGFVDGATSAQSRSHPSDRAETQSQSGAVEVSGEGIVSLQTLVFTLLAVVTRLWLVALLQGQSIIVLFLATKVFLFFIGLEQTLVQGGPARIITALLTYRGVSPHTVHRLQQWLGFLQGTLRDFSTYLFVFVMVHAVLEWSSSPDLDRMESFEV